MAYTRINWENEPSVNTPINEDNLNHMEDGIVQNETDIAGKMDVNNPTGTGSLQVGTGNMKTDGNPSYALGYNAYAEGDNSFAFGSGTRAKKQGAYAIGIHAEAREYYSMALGEEVIAASIHQTARGKYNEIDADGVYLDIVGGGNPLERKNVETLTPNGDKWVAGDYTNGNGETLHGIYEALPVDSASGNPAVITDAFGGNCKSLKLTFEPIQSGSGTPSPQNVRPIAGRTQSVVTRTGKNVLPVTLENIKAYNTAGTWNGNEYTALGITFTVNTNADGDVTSIKMNGTCNASYNATLYLTQPNFIKNDYKGKILSGCYTGAYSTYFLYVSYSSDGTTWANEARQSTVDYTISSSYDYVGFSAMVYKGNTVNNVYVYPMVRESSSDASFEPYNGESITIQLGQTVYGGVLDVTSGTLTIDYVLQNYVWGIGSAASTDLGSNTRKIWYLGYTPDLTKTMYCDVAPYLANYTSDTIHFYLGASTAIVFLPTNTASDFSFNIAYALATPTTIQLTPEEVTLLKGDNVLTTDADSIEASYSADIALYIEKKIAEGSQGNRSLSKGGSSDEEVKEEVKEEEIEIKEEPLTKEVR